MTEKHISENKKIIPLISIITVVFDSKAMVRDTIENVLQQTYDNFEFIVIDGASTDGTIDVIREYDRYIDYWQSKEDRGIYHAMNKGINAANGKYLIFLNAGDVFSNENVLDLVAKAAMLNNYPEVLYGETNIFTENGEFINKFIPLHFSRLNLILFGTRTVSHQSIFVKKEIAPLYDESYQLKGELCWYFDILKKNSKLESILLSYPVANYLLGGKGDVLFWKNIWERLRVVARKEGVIGCVIVIPFLVIPLVFRLKKVLLSSLHLNIKKK